MKFALMLYPVAKYIGGIFQHALTFFSQDSSSQSCTSPGPKDGPESPKCTSGSPKQKRTSGTMFQFPFREGRPSLSELRGLKKTANSRVFSERVGSNQVEKTVTSPKQNHSQKRTQAQCKKPGVAVKSNREKSEPAIHSETWESKDSSKITDSYIHPKHINYAKIPQYPYEMHESKIVSLKKKTNGNFMQSNPTQNPPQPQRNNVMHYQRARQLGKPPSQVASTLRNPKSYPAAFYSPSGRSLSFNNIAMSSDDSSSEEEYEIYEELPHELANNTRQNGQIMYPDMDPNFTRQVAEVYTMLSQRQNFLQSQRNNGYRGPINATNAAIIDELALRMYHALRMNHMQSQRLAQEKQQNRQYYPKTNVPNSNNVPLKSDFSSVPGNLPEENMQKMHPPPKYRGPSEPHVSDKNFSSDSVHEHPVDLPPSGYVPHRNVNPVFKSATSQEIHNLYTSQLSNKSVSSHHENEKLLDCIPESNEKDHTYETIPYQKSKCETTSNYKDKYEEKIFLYPAEKELERKIPCKDDQSLSDNQVPVVSNLRENIFCPIKEGYPLKNKAFEHLSAFKPVKSDKSIENSIENQVDDITNFYNKNVQSAISSLMMNIPKPPKESYTGSTTKSSSSQTESLLCDSNDTFQTEISYIDNDESFISQFGNSSAIEPNYCSSSSLNSSSSGSTISSAGSCYYYVETQIKPQFTVKFPSVTSENGEDAPLIDLRSPTLPTMGVSMLGKKRSTSSSGSEQGSNAGSRGSPCVPVITDIDALKSPRIVTDVDCPSNWFNCGNGKCIAKMWLCDEDNDCGNLKDEENCEGRVHPEKCLSNQFQCRKNGHCVPESWRCDGEHDCGDSSDEKDCASDKIAGHDPGSELLIIISVSVSLDVTGSGVTFTGASTSNGLEQSIKV
ncbi:uncharacterized protein LOC129228319 [Uloborus diversus]|uniref:uncharacterized protein LOC129228319 n=1 Tax=Uloborus diversus TaxID=327109 RepID=UPI002408FA4F|nr:uncharacterized protein LOC129228319 [Uloborus diversus]